MATGLYSGVSGLAIGVGLNKGVTGLWSGASGLIAGWGGGFNPLTLFASGEQGAWYDPSDLSTMFQDTAGTTPVTATGQTVGLLLDKSQGLVLGPELVTNGTFDTNLNGWTVANLGTGATASWSSSFGGSAALPRIDASNTARIYQNYTTVVGRTYKITFDVNTADGVIIAVGTTNAGSETLVATNVDGNRTATFYIAATGTTFSLSFRGRVNGATAFIDNISVKELPGNHATQATAASRPIYGIEPFGGRRNLLSWTEQFDNAYWVKTNLTVTADAAAPPNQSATADKLIATAVNGQHTAESAIIMAAATVYTASVTAKADGLRYLTINSQGSQNQGACFDLQAGTLAIAAGPAVSATNIISLGDGWYRISMTFTNSFSRLSFAVHNAPSNGFLSYTGNGTDGILLWGAQLETGSTATAYQRVTDQWNVTQAGVPSVSYLAFDGTDDFMLTGTITPGIDKAQVFAGVRKLSDAARGMVLETGLGNQSGSIALQAPSANGAANYGPLAGGTTIVGVNPTTFTAPITNVVSFAADIPADSLVARINGSQVAQIANDQGTGNFLAYPLYIGRRGGTGLPYNGRIYQMLIRFGANLTSNDLAAAEVFTNQKTGAY